MNNVIRLVVDGVALLGNDRNARPDSHLACGVTPGVTGAAAGHSKIPTIFLNTDRPH